jgi:hypothetical protein
MTRAVFFAIIFFCPLCSFAQTKNPCEDQTFLRLKALPKASLTESEQAYLKQMNDACNRAKNAGIPPSPPQALHLSVPKGDISLDSLEEKKVGNTEDFATARNLGIIGAIGAALIGIGIALGSVTSSPF